MKRPAYIGGVNSPRPFAPLPRSRALLRALWAVLACAGSAGAVAQGDPSALAEPLAAQVRQVFLDRVIGPATPRAEVVLGKLDPRLRLAACNKVDVYIPTGTR